VKSDRNTNLVPTVSAVRLQVLAVTSEAEVWAISCRFDLGDRVVPDLPTAVVAVTGKAAVQFQLLGSTFWIGDQSATVKMLLTPKPDDGELIEIVLDRIRTDPSVSDATLRQTKLRRSDLMGPWVASLVYHFVD